MYLARRSRGSTIETQNENYWSSLLNFLRVREILINRMTTPSNPTTMGAFRANLTANQPRFRTATSVQPFHNNNKTHFKSFPRGYAPFGHAHFAFPATRREQISCDQRVPWLALRALFWILKSSGKQPTIVQRTEAWTPENKNNTEKRKF